MAFVTECRPGPDATWSSRDVSKVVSVSPPEFESLRSPLDFNRVLKKGKRRRSGGVVAVTCSGRPGSPRVGLIISKSAGKAVTRNRIKRRLRHALRVVELQPGTDYVIIGSRQLADAPHPQLMGWLRRALGDTDV